MTTRQILRRFLSDQMIELTTRQAQLKDAFRVGWIAAGGTEDRWESKCRESSALCANFEAVKKNGDRQAKVVCR